MTNGLHKYISSNKNIYHIFISNFIKQSGTFLRFCLSNSVQWLMHSGKLLKVLKDQYVELYSFILFVSMCNIIYSNEITNAKKEIIKEDLSYKIKNFAKFSIFLLKEKYIIWSSSKGVHFGNYILNKINMLFLPKNKQKRFYVINGYSMKPEVKTNRKHNWLKQ